MQSTGDSELFVNPLMAMYLAVDLPALARTVGYLPHLRSRPEPRPVTSIPRRLGQTPLESLIETCSTSGVSEKNVHVILARLLGGSR
ncbi:hypothetical protein AB0H71_06145 [Nocardia sp. NPDC050697]|uniref:hypothetical protein n=1 Tax=Nocardia sp. NPDC050697 TaxID=3155158 RepID=UPI00340CE4E4